MFLSSQRQEAQQAASTSQMGRIKTEVLTQPKNLSAPMGLSGMGIDTVRHEPADSLSCGYSGTEDHVGSDHVIG